MIENNVFCLSSLILFVYSLHSTCQAGQKINEKVLFLLLPQNLHYVCLPEIQAICCIQSALAFKYSMWMKAKFKYPLVSL